MNITLKINWWHFQGYNNILLLYITKYCLINMEYIYIDVGIHVESNLVQKAWHVIALI